MKIHLIAIGGAAMHNIAIALHKNGHIVTGSDDEIYNPAKDRLQQHGLLPAAFGWHPEKLDPQTDVVILGMHARADNPELLRAQELGLHILSYPAFIYEHARNKKRFVIAGSHGKTTTTAMVMHCLRQRGIDFDYLVGAQLEGFDTMVRFSDAPYLVVEGDEYFASPLDLVSKMILFRAHTAVVTGIAWDHINVFPTFESYLDQFRKLLDSIEPDGSVIWYGLDAEMSKIVQEKERPLQSIPFVPFEAEVRGGRNWVTNSRGEETPLLIFGTHNLLDARAASLVCKEMGVSEDEFLEDLASFAGAAKRLQTLVQRDGFSAWLDFAHAPSKVKATVQAVKSLYPERKLFACLELHTFSSLNRDFLPQYAGALDHADAAIVYFSPHTLAMKRLPAFTQEEVAAAFGHPNLRVITDRTALEASLAAQIWEQENLLLMSSGTFDGLDLQKFK